MSHAAIGHSVKTVSFFPAEIRAPAGTPHGVSGYQICFSQKEVFAPEPQVDFLIALNPAAYWVSKDKVALSGRVICDSELWGEKSWTKAGLDYVDIDNLDHKIIKVPLTEVTLAACQDSSLTFSQAKKNRNFTALGLVLWLSDLCLEDALSWLEDKFSLKQDVLMAARSCLKAGYNLGETLEIEQTLFSLEKRDLAYQKQMKKRFFYSVITGNQAISLGCIAMAQRTKKKSLSMDTLLLQHRIFLNTEKVATGSDVLQAEDEMAAMGMALGAAWGGHLSLTCTSGPGFDLKTELLGLGASAELPCVVVNVQRAGPSTGMPTKVEQSDLMASIWGRHGDCPLPVLAPFSAESCLLSRKAFQWAIKAQCPVIVLSDLALAQSTGQVDLENIDLSAIELPVPENKISFEQLHVRDENFAKPWVVPGMKGGQSCIGGLEKDKHSGQVSYDGQNHEQMVHIRHQKVQALSQVCDRAPDKSENDILILSFGSSSLFIKQWLIDKGHSSLDHWILTDIVPLPRNFTEVLSRYREVIVVEMNHGQLIYHLKAQELLKPVLWHSWCWQRSTVFDQNWLDSQLLALKKGEKTDA